MIKIDQYIINNSMMAKGKENIGKMTVTKRTRIIKAPINDGRNTPASDSGPVPVISKIEAALFKQAENPLGDPNKI